MKPSRALFEDDRGAVMLIAVFFAVFAVSMLYLAIGAGESVLYREHLQDAADSAALSGAITHARIMNVLVLINMVMVTLLAILVTLKLIEGVAILGIAIAAGLAWCSAGTSLAAIPPLKSLQSTMSGIYDDVEPTIFNALETLHDVGEQIKVEAPTLANEMGKGDLYGREDGIVLTGIATSTANELPVDDDTYEGLCGKAGKLSWQIANFPLSPLPGWGAISEALSGPMQTLTSSLSAWFCGDGENSVPDLSQNVPMGYPKTQKALDCEASVPTDLAVGHEKDATTDKCQEADAERIAGTPDDSGNCKEQCQTGGPYDLGTMAAREKCDPSISPAAKQYRYQVQEGTVQYKWNGLAWVRGEPHFTKSTSQQEPVDSLPCKTSYSAFSLSTKRDVDGNVCGRVTSEGYFPGYNKKVHPVSDPDRVLPVCTNECAPKSHPGKNETNPTRKVSFSQVTHVFSCVREERKEVEVGLTKESPNSQASDEGNSKSPKTIAKGVNLGDEPFQVRSVAIGSQKQRESSRLVRLGLWGKPDPENPLERLRDLGGFTIAQAEYYFDGDGGPDVWMWEMNWRGRLKRFELPTDDDANSALHDACNATVPASKDCSRVLDLAKDWQDLLLH